MTLPQPVWSECGLTFLDENANLGVKNFGLRLTVDGVPVDIHYRPMADGEKGAEAEAGVLALRSTAESVEGCAAIVLRHRFTNPLPRPIRIAGVETGVFASTASVPHGRGHALGWDLRCAHTDHVRTDRNPHCQMEYPYFRMLPARRVRLGQGEDQPFPGLYIRDEKGRRGLVFAAASQNVNFLAFELEKRGIADGRGAFEHFALLHDPGQSAGFTVPALGDLALDGVFIQLVGDVRVEDAYAGYLAWLSGRVDFRAPRSPLLREAMHCTWNYGVSRDQNPKSLLPTARFIAASLPGIKWFLMDAGYLDGDNGECFLHRFYPDPEQFVNRAVWPGGIRGFSDEIRAMGLRPGIWWAPVVRVASRLFDDHPDWFLRNADGSLCLIDTSRGLGCLDYSHPEALAFLDRTLSVILGKWGMDACKMDFWSQHFESRRARFANPDLTSPQVRARFLETVRRHLPPDGVFMTCIAAGMGDPFVGQWADCYRNTIDIGLGRWSEQRNNCAWSLPTFGFGGRGVFLLNNDSVGIMPGHPDNENRFRFTWSFMHGGMTETGGRIETWFSPWVEALRKLTDRCDRGYQARCPDDDAFTGVPLPKVLYIDYPPESPTARSGVRQSLAFFNWTDEDAVISVRRAGLGHDGPVEAEDFWTGAAEVFDQDFIVKSLAPRSALLYDLSDWP